LTCVVNLLHVKEPQAPRGPLSKIIGHFPSKVSVEALRWADHSFKESCWLWTKDQETEKEARAHKGCRAIREEDTHIDQMIPKLNKASCLIRVLKPLLTLRVLKNGLFCFSSFNNIIWYNILGEFCACKNHI
jgi:hypothetical protein